MIHLLPMFRKINTECVLFFAVIGETATYLSPSGQTFLSNGEWWDFFLCKWIAMHLSFQYVLFYWEENGWTINGNDNPILAEILLCFIIFIFLVIF